MPARLQVFTVPHRTVIARAQFGVFTIAVVSKQAQLCPVGASSKPYCIVGKVQGCRGVGRQGHIPLTRIEPRNW